MIPFYVQIYSQKLAPISNPKFTISFMEWAKDQQEVVKLSC